MERFSGRLAALGLAAVMAAGSAQAQVVISQVYGGGGNSGATLRSDFIELHNTGATAVDINGWSVQYASSTGSTWQRTTLSGSIAPGAYYLVKQADGSGGTVSLPTPDAAGTIGMSGSAGKVALVSNGTLLTGTCPPGSAVVDFVGFGSAANCSEGSPTATLSNTTAAIRADEGCTDTGNNAIDFATGTPVPRNSASAPRVCGGVVARLLSIADAQAAEGQAGTRTLAFLVTLTQPAGPGGVSIRWSTADGSATAGEDYAAVAHAEALIPAGADRVELLVTIAGDTLPEDDETLHVRIDSATGADIADGSATGTIVNDDFPLVPIAQIQGAGERSPLAGRVVATRGIVTGRKSTGFFIQSRDVDADADPATSEGLFVFLRTMPDFIAPGRWVQVRGTVIEYVPTDDPGQAPLTEIGGTVVVSEVDAATYPLPAPVELSTSFPSPTGPLDQLERVEGMRVTVPDFVVTAPTDGFTDERNATGGSNGLFHGTVAGLPRPFREPGIQAPDAPPAGTIPPIPQWDFNPELITVDSDAIGGTRLDVSTGARIANLTGPLDYGFRRYTLLPDSVGAVTPGMAPRAAKAVPADAITVAGYNLERFFDDVNDGAADDATLTTEAYARRLSKASLAIREYLHTPDIVGLVEIESQKVVDDLAARLNADAVAAGDADPRYVGHLFEGNDPGGIDVAVLVKTADVAAGTPRVQVRQVLQIGKDTTWTQPDGNTALLNDRPPLLLDAVVHHADGRSFPLNVVVVHQRSLNGAEDATPAGERVRAKRQRQAEFLAGFLEGLQKASDDARLLVLGDFNAFEFNDGLAHVMGTVTGQPAPDAETAVAGDGGDYVEDDLVNLGTLEPLSERYSFVFGGNAQTLDHVLVSEDLVVATRELFLDHARINADFPESNRSDATSPSRLADHDPVIAYIVPRRIADLAMAASAPAQAHTGGELRFDVSLSNVGPQRADRPVIAFDLDADVAARVDAPTGWDCGSDAAPADITRLLCRSELLADDAVAAFTVRAPATAALLGRTVTLLTAVSAQSQDRVAANDAASAASTVVSTADLAVALDGPGRHLRRGSVGRYVARVGNLGPDLAVAPELVLWGDAPAANVALDAPAGWDCEVAAAAGGFQALCTTQELAAGAKPTIGARITAPRRAGDPRFTVHARVGTRSTDGNAANDEDRYESILIGPPR